MPLFWVNGLCESMNAAHPIYLIQRLIFQVPSHSNFDSYLDKRCVDGPLSSEESCSFQHLHHHQAVPHQPFELHLPNLKWLGPNGARSNSTAAPFTSSRTSNKASSHIFLARGFCSKKLIPKVGYLHLLSRLCKPIIITTLITLVLLPPSVRIST